MIQVHLGRLNNIESGTIALRDEPFDLPALLGDLQIACTKAATQKGLAIRLAEVAEGNWLVRGDERRVHQAVDSLIDNAVKFSNHGEITLTLSRPDPSNPSRIDISVADQGIGIAPEHQGALFQSFVQLDNGADRRYEGSGLGLVIVRRLAEAMGGCAGLTSAPGTGSRFWIQLCLPPAVTTTRDTAHDVTDGALGEIQDDLQND